MRRAFVWLAALSCTARTFYFEDVDPEDGRPIATFAATPGWHELAGTEIMPHCPDPQQHPDIQGTSGCSCVICWSGAIADTRRNRLLIWGGGTTDYWGNEVYALELAPLRMRRLTDPSPHAEGDDMGPDGLPAARSTYSGMAYMPDRDAWFVYGGRTGCGTNGCALDRDSTWLHDFGSGRWTRASASSPPGVFWGPTADWNPETGRVLMMLHGDLWDYDPAVNRWDYILSTDQFEGLGGAIDPVNRRFVVAGLTYLRAYDLGTFAEQRWEDAPGCAALRDSYAPGVAFDPVSARLVAWLGGPSVIALDAAGPRCETVTGPGDPGEAPQQVYGRWRYFEDFGVFVAVPDATRPAFAFRPPF